MRIQNSIVAVLYFAIFFSIQAKAQKSGSLESVTQLVVEGVVDFKKTPGVVVGLIDKNQKYVFGYGRIAKDSVKMPNGKTIFEIGSITKLFTATIIARMQQKGMLHYDKSVGDYFKEGLENLNYKNKKLSILDILRHTSGLPLLPANFGNKEVDVKNPYSAYTYKDLYDFIKEYRNTEPFGDKYAYSHIGYALLTKIIEALSKADYETVLENEITKNWNMPDTKIHLSAENTKRLAQGYSRSQQPTVAWTYQCFEGAMGLKSTADDLLNFLERHLTDATLWDMQQARFIQKQKNSFNTAIGWFLMKPQKKVYDIVLHSGHTSGHRAYIAFVRETQTAVVVLANSEEEINDLPIMLLKMLNDNWKRKQ